LGCGEAHTIAVVGPEGSELASTGQNDAGQTGRGGSMNLESLGKVSLPPGTLEEPIRLLACGQHHTILVLESGLVFGFGENEAGQLGLGTHIGRPGFSAEGHTSQSSSDVLQPTRVTGLDGQAISEVVCGAQHTLALYGDGSLWGSGSNTFGELGFGAQRKAINAFAEVPYSSGGPDEVDVRVVHLVCGLRHSLFLNGLGQVMGCGDNSKGQLGLGHVSKQFTLKVLRVEANRIKVMGCGRWHSALLSETKEVFVTGDNSQGQLGLPTTRATTSFLKSKALSKPNLQWVGCGGDFTICLDFEGAAYGVGYNEDGALSLGHCNNVWEPQRVVCGGRRIKEIVCGLYHTFLAVQ